MQVSWQDGGRPSAYSVPPQTTWLKSTIEADGPAAGAAAGSIGEVWHAHFGICILQGKVIGSDLHLENCVQLCLTHLEVNLTGWVLTPEEDDSQLTNSSDTRREACRSMLTNRRIPYTSKNESRHDEYESPKQISFYVPFLWMLHAWLYKLEPGGLFCGIPLKCP